MMADDVFFALRANVAFIQLLLFLQLPLFLPLFFEFELPDESQIAGGWMEKR